jgi:hypothetical protein
VIRRPVAQEGHARRRPTRATAHASCPRRKRAPTTTSARPVHHGILAPCPLRRPCCQHVLPRPRRATTCRRWRAAQASRPKAHSAVAHPASSIPASARAHPHACWNAAGCAIHAATWTDELCNSEPTLVQSSRTDEPTASNRRQRMTSHATALGADQRHRERAVLADVQIVSLYCRDVFKGRCKSCCGCCRSNRRFES